MKWELADGVLIAHALLAVSIFGGLVFAVAGHLMKWRWTWSWRWRIPHLLIVLYLVARAQCRSACPLSEWEDAIRVSAVTSTRTRELLHWLAFREMDGVSFRSAMTVFGLVTIGLFLYQRLGRKWGEKDRGAPGM